MLSSHKYDDSTNSEPMAAAACVITPEHPPIALCSAFSRSGSTLASLQPYNKRSRASSLLKGLKQNIIMNPLAEKRLDSAYTMLNSIYTQLERMRERHLAQTSAREKELEKRNNYTRLSQVKIECDSLDSQYLDLKTRLDEYKAQPWSRKAATDEFVTIYDDIGTLLKDVRRAHISFTQTTGSLFSRTKAVAPSIATRSSSCLAQDV